MTAHRILACVLLLVAVSASAQGPSNLPPIQHPNPMPVLKPPPRVPATAATLCLADLETISPLLQPSVRYVWLRDSSKQTYAAVTLFLNSVVNRSSVPVQPPLVAGGALIRVEGWRYGDTIEQVKEQMRIWDSLSEKDPYFYISQTDSKSKKTIVESAPHLDTAFPVGLCYRYDWLIKQGGTSADGGSYYAFRGLVPGKTKLADYLAERGVPLERIRQHNSFNRLVTISKVTGKARGIEMYESSDVPPSEGPSIVVVTQDIFDDQTDPGFDAFLSLRNSKSQGQESLAKLRNGAIECTLWNGDGILVSEAPPNLVRDSLIPEPFTDRLQPMISCIRCHGPNGLWQPATNQVKQLLDGRLRVLGDVTINNDQKQFEAIRQIQFLYGARQSQLDKVLGDARDSFDTFTFVTGGLTAKDVCEAMTLAYNNYEYKYLDAASACDELGVDPDGDPIAVLTKILPAPNQGNLIATDARIALLLTPADPMVKWLVEEKRWDWPKGADKKSLKITRRQFEPLYPALQSLVMPTLGIIKPKLVDKPKPTVEMNPTKIELPQSVTSPRPSTDEIVIPDFESPDKSDVKPLESDKNEPKWWYITEGTTRQRGPLTYADLQELASSGKLKPNDLLWNNRHRQGDWAAASKVKGLFPDEVQK
jgi:hypothetical protein